MHGSSILVAALLFRQVGDRERARDGGKVDEKLPVHSSKCEPRATVMAAY